MEAGDLSRKIFEVFPARGKQLIMELLSRSKIGRIELEQSESSVSRAGSAGTERNNQVFRGR